ncbi:hypothetical protein J4526_09095 [Desulfurococcaceae archaeon MEX13E-LK6-19]|nr:hypothetical protein J4526_09095 [Desulfurococcaceae archaeon MEX13E-LK6-19]
MFTGTRKIRVIVFISSVFLFLAGFMYDVLFVPSIILEFYSLAPRGMFLSQRRTHRTFFIVAGIILVSIFSMGVLGIESFEDRSIIRHLATGFWFFLVPGILSLLHGFGIGVIPQDLDNYLLNKMATYRDTIINNTIKNKKFLYMSSLFSLFAFGTILMLGYVFMSFLNNADSITIDFIPGFTGGEVVVSKTMITLSGLVLGFLVGILPGMYAVKRYNEIMSKSITKEYPLRKLFLIIRYFILFASMILIFTGLLIIVVWRTYESIYAGLFILILSFWIINISENPFTLVIMNDCYTEVFNLCRKLVKSIIMKYIYFRKTRNINQ